MNMNTIVTTKNYRDDEVDVSLDRGHQTLGNCGSASSTVLTQPGCTRLLAASVISLPFVLSIGQHRAVKLTVVNVPWEAS